MVDSLCVVGRKHVCWYVGVAGEQTHVKPAQASRDLPANPPETDDADGFPLDAWDRMESFPVPFKALDAFLNAHEFPRERKHEHHGVVRDIADVIDDVRDKDVFLGRSSKVDVIDANAVPRDDFHVIKLFNHPRREFRVLVQKRVRITTCSDEFFFGGALAFHKLDV